MLRMILPLVAAAGLSGCLANERSTPPQSASAPAPKPAKPKPTKAEPEAPAPVERPDLGLSNIAVGAPDSTESIPGSSDARYTFRFAQVLPGSGTFTYQDRDLSFYFRPTPGALHVQIENRQNRPVIIDWDRSSFLDPRGSVGKVAHASTRWEDRFTVQSPTQISGLQRYSDYLLPLDYLLDPAGTNEQLHRPLLPEDTTAPQYADKEFGVDLVFRIEDQPRRYPFRFRVASVIPR
jgi:hypothetical protein